MVISSLFLRRFEEPKWSLKIVRRSLKICKFALKQFLIAVLFTNQKLAVFQNCLMVPQAKIIKKTGYIKLKHQTSIILASLH